MDNTTELEKIQKACTQARDEENVIRLRIEQHERTLTDKQKEIAEAQSLLDDTIDRSNKATVVLKGIEKDMVAKRSDSSLLDTQIYDKQESLKKLVKSHEDTAQSFKEAHETKVKKHQAEIAEVVSQHGEEKNALIKTQTEHSNVSKQLEDKNQDISKADNKLRVLGADIGNLIEAINASKREEEKQKGKNAKLAREEATLNDSIATAKIELGTVKDQTNQAKTKLNEVTDQVSLKEKELEGHSNKSFALAKREQLADQRAAYIKKCFEIAGVPLPTEEEIKQ